MVLSLLALLAVLVGVFSVLAPFVTPILWALVFGSATWPAYRRLRGWLGERRTVAALLMTTMLLVLVLAPILGLGVVLVRELGPELERLSAWSTAEKPVLPAFLERLPFLGELVNEIVHQVGDPVQRTEWAHQTIQRSGEVLIIGGNLLRVLAKLFFTVFTLFFVYRDGDTLKQEFYELLNRLSGDRGQALVAAVRETVRAVFFGWLMTAMAQGLFAMAGFWIAGVRAPVLLGVATGFFAVIPFGATVVWAPTILMLAAQGAWWQTVFLTIWCVGIVSTIDNFLRPLFISGPARVPFILVFFGVLGGLASFGLLGLVLGPVFLAVAFSIWRQAKQTLHPFPPEPSQVDDANQSPGPPPR